MNDLRQTLAQHVDKVYISKERVHKTEKSIHEPEEKSDDQTAIKNT